MDSLFPFKFLFLNSDDFIASVQFDTSNMSVGIFDSTNIALLRTLDYVNSQANETISWAASHGP